MRQKSVMKVENVVIFLHRTLSLLYLFVSVIFVRFVVAGDLSLIFRNK